MRWHPKVGEVDRYRPADNVVGGLKERDEFGVPNKKVIGILISGPRHQLCREHPWSDQLAGFVGASELPEPNGVRTGVKRRPKAEYFQLARGRVDPFPGDLRRRIAWFLRENFQGDKNCGNGNGEAVHYCYPFLIRA